MSSGRTRMCGDRDMTSHGRSTTDVSTTIRPGIQLAAQQALSGHADGATAVIDPRSGDVWAVASQPAFDPNAMTLGTTLGGQPLSAPGEGAIFDKAVLGAYPAGTIISAAGR